MPIQLNLIEFIANLSISWGFQYGLVLDKIDFLQSVLPFQPLNILKDEEQGQTFHETELETLTETQTDKKTVKVNVTKN